MEIERFILRLTFSIILATVLPFQKSPITSLAQDPAPASTASLSSAASSLGTAISETFSEVTAIKSEELQFVYKTLRMSLGFVTNLLGRSLNGLGTTLDLATNGLGALRSYTETGTGYLADGASSVLRYGSSTIGSAGQAAKNYGTGWIDLPAGQPAAPAARK